MSDRYSRSVRIVVALIIAIAFIAGGAVITPSANGQPSNPSVSEARSLASNADLTSQSMTMDIPLPPQTISCTLDTSSMRQYGVTLQSVSVSGTDKLSMSVNPESNIDMTIQKGSGSEAATVMIQVSTNNITIPDSKVEHTTNCGGQRSASQSIGQLLQLAVPAAAQQSDSGFSIEETGIQDTNKTQIQSDDTVIRNDTTLTQSLDLNLIVPDDGDSDGDTYNVTINTSDSVAHGINITGAAVENDPSGPSTLVEVTDTTVTDTEDVTLTIREAAANRSDGNISQETITVSLDLDATQHNTGQFSADSTVQHVISDEAGNTTSTVSYESKEAQSTSTPSVTVTQRPDTVQENSSFTIDYELTSNDAALTIEVSNLSSGITVDNFAGDVKSQDTENNPPSASTDLISAGSTGTVTITYQVSANVTDTNQTSVNRSVEVSARDPLSGDSDRTTTTLTVEESSSTPTDPQERALEIVGKSDPSEITQNDVTTAITRFDRGQSVNGINITQNDITTTITLFERN